MSTTVPLACTRCGGPLSAPTEQTIACTYCGLVNRIAIGNTQLRAVVREVLAEEQQPRGPQGSPPQASLPAPVPPADGIPSRPLPAKKVSTGAVVAAVLGVMSLSVGTIALGGLLTSSGSRPPSRQPFGGELPPFWSVPVVPAAPVERATEVWMSTPVRGEDGTVAGLVRVPGAWAFVQLDEATGAERWRTVLPRFLSNFQRPLAWTLNEDVVQVPLALEGGPYYAIAWQREFALVERQGGRLVQVGSFPASVPDVSAAEGACFIDGKFWIGVGRAGVGAWLEPTGQMAASSSPRPATCFGLPSAISRGSPLQNARANRNPYPEFCGDRDSHTAEAIANMRDGVSSPWCKERRGDDTADHDVLIYDQKNLGLRSGSKWRLFGHFDNDHYEFYAPPDSIELAGEWVFLNHLSKRTVAQAAPTGSFEGSRSIGQAQSIITAINREGEAIWTQAVARTMSDKSESLRATMFASHPRSKHKNLYVLQPGSLLVLDQATGRPRWKVGGAGKLEAPAASSSPEPVKPAKVSLRIDSRDVVLERALQSARGRVTTCASTYPSESGHVDVQLTIDGKGKVSKAETRSSTLNDPSLTACVAGSFEQAVVPPGSKGTTVRVSLTREP